jgi:hypothetical protein
MTKRLALLFAALMVLGFVVAGCGDDDDDGGSGSSDAPAETEKKADDGGGSGGGTVDKDDPRVKQAIEQCKEQADANSSLSAEARKKIGDVCEEAGSGDADGAVKATKEACKIVVEDTVPEGNPARESALGNCDLVGAGQ